MNERSDITSGSRVCGYARDSGGGEQDQSVDQQVKAISEFCQDNDLVLSRVFSDRARPGSTTAGRDAFMEMLTYLERGVPERGVIFWSYSRFSRSYDDLIYYITHIRKLDKTVISLTDTIPDTLDGRILESITAWKNAKYLEDLSRDIARGLRHTILNLKAWPGGRAPVGYRLEAFEAGRRRDGAPRTNSRLVPDPDKAPLVRKAFAMRAEGCTAPEILNEVDIAGSPASIGRILKNKIYIGVLEYGDMTVRDFCDPLVDQPTWNAAQKVNRARRKRYGYDHPRAVRSRFILTGLLRCARCNSPMHSKITINPNGAEYTYYRCQSQNTDPPGCGALFIPQEEIEGRVVEVMLSEVLTPGTLRALMDEVERQAREGSGEARDRIERLRAKSQDLAARITRVVAAIEDYGHSNALLEQLGGLEEDERQAREELAQAEAEAMDYRVDLGLDVEGLAGEVRAVLEVADYVERARVLRSFIKEIRAQKDGEITGEMVVYLLGRGEKVLEF